MEKESEKRKFKEEEKGTEQTKSKKLKTKKIKRFIEIEAGILELHSFPNEIINMIIDNLQSFTDIINFLDYHPNTNILKDSLLIESSFWRILILKDFPEVVWKLDDEYLIVPPFMLSNPFLLNQPEYVIFKNTYLWYRVFFRFVRKLVYLNGYLTPNDDQVNNDKFLKQSKKIKFKDCEEGQEIYYKSIDEIRSIRSKSIATQIINSPSPIIKQNGNNNIITFQNIRFSFPLFKNLFPVSVHSDNLLDNILPKIDIRILKPILIIDKMNDINSLYFKDPKESLNGDTFFIEKYNQITPLFNLTNKISEIRKEVLFVPLEDNPLGDEVINLMNQKKVNQNIEINQIVVPVIYEISQIKLIETLFGEQIKWKKEIELKSLKKRYCNKNDLVTFRSIDDSSFFKQRYFLNIGKCYSTLNRLNLPIEQKEIKVISFITTREILNNYFNEKNNSFLIKEKNPILNTFILPLLERKKQEYETDTQFRLISPIDPLVQLPTNIDQDIISVFTVEYNRWTFIEDILISILNGNIFHSQKRFGYYYYSKLDKSLFIKMFSILLAYELGLFELYPFLDEYSLNINIELSKHLLNVLPKEKKWIRILSEIMSEPPYTIVLSKENEREEFILLANKI